MFDYPVFVSGRGMVSSREMAVDRAVQEYDERLRFGLNEQTGDYCILIKMPPDFQWGVVLDGWGPYFPVLGFGKEIPTPDAALRKLYRSDTVRHGEEMLDRMNRNNERAINRKRAEFDDISGQTAEALEWGFRKKGEHPSPRVFVPKGIEES